MDWRGIESWIATELGSGHRDRSCRLVQDQRFNRLVARHNEYMYPQAYAYSIAGRAGQWPYRQELYTCTGPGIQQMGGSASRHHFIPRHTLQYSRQMDRSCTLVPDHRFNRWVARHPGIPRHIDRGCTLVQDQRFSRWVARHPGIMNTGIPRHTVHYSRQSRPVAI
jgi:hypothetical protein